MNPSGNDKLYYKIGEVSKMIGIEPYVIRYWEKEFKFLKPYKTKSSHRLYSKLQIEKLLLIKDFLYNQKYTIDGARKALKNNQSFISRQCFEEADSFTADNKNINDRGDSEDSNISKNLNIILMNRALAELNEVKLIAKKIEKPFKV